MAGLISPQGKDLHSPRFVSLKEFRDKLAPVLAGWAWADDSINDLWMKGAPDPNSFVCGNNCPARECPHIKRVLLPKMFAAWWQEVCERQGREITALQALNGKFHG